jgi:hypothetical protein
MVILFCITGKMSTNLVQGSHYQNICNYIRLGMQCLYRGSRGVEPVAIVQSRGRQYSERSPLPLRLAVPEQEIRNSGYFLVAVFDPSVNMEQILQPLGNHGIPKMELNFTGTSSAVCMHSF